MLDQGSRSARVRPGRGRDEAKRVAHAAGVRAAKGSQAAAATQKERSPEEGQAVEQAVPQKGAQHLRAALDHQARDTQAGESLQGEVEAHAPRSARIHHDRGAGALEGLSPPGVDVEADDDQRRLSRAPDQSAADGNPVARVEHDAKEGSRHARPG